jgi:hypothetical protein
MIQINTVPILWKGAATTETMPALRLNQPTDGDGHMFRAAPLRSYRREVGNNTNASIYTMPRSNIQISTYPGHANTTKISAATAADVNRIEQATIVNYPNNSSEHPGTAGEAGCQMADSCLSVSQNARNRVRSSGNMSVKYYNSSSQLLRARNRSFAQNTVPFANYCPDGSACAVASPENAYTDGRYTNGKYVKYCADSASTQILKTKYNTITSAAAAQTDAFGAAVANELAYSSNTSAAYTLKTKTGYPLTQYPTFPKYSGQTTACSAVRG